MISIITMIITMIVIMIVIMIITMIVTMIVTMIIAKVCSCQAGSTMIVIMIITMIITMIVIMIITMIVIKNQRKLPVLCVIFCALETVFTQLKTSCMSNHCKNLSFLHLNFAGLRRQLPKDL